MPEDASDLEYLALLEEQDRRLAQDSFLSFYMRMTGFFPQPHHRLVCKLLQAMEDDKVDRAMVFMPRRMAKSTLCTQLFPAFIMGKYPDEKVMSAVHTQKYAQKTGKIVRNYVKSPLFPFDIQLADDSQAKDQWGTTEGGEYNGFGLMGGSTHGNPASWLIMDDLIKGRKMAMSEHMREEAWETYKSDLASSLQGRKKQLIVTTRWHMDDPPGRILPEKFDGKSGWYRDRETDEPWYVVSLPAAAEDDDALGRPKGEYLWPEEFTGKFDAAKKRGGWIWSALYQQRPAPEEGLMFSVDHIQRYDPLTIDLTAMQIYLASDYATTAEAGAIDPDYTVHLAWAVDQEFNIYLLDIWRGRRTPDIWAREFIRMCKKWKPLRAGEEAGQIIKSVGPFLNTMLEEERVFVDRIKLTSSVGKEQRAQALLGMAAMGKMYFPHRHLAGTAFAGTAVTCAKLDDLDAMEKELLQFPGGKHDDTVDAATLFARMLDRIIAGRKPKRPASEHGETLDDLFARHEADKRRRERDNW